MTVEELLGDLERLNHGGRVRAMVALGRRGDDESRALIAELERGGFYERSLALYSCFGSRDGEHALRGLGDPSRLLRGLATQLIALLGDDAQALRGLENAEASARGALAQKLAHYRRQDVIDTYLSADTLSETVVRALLPFASAATGERLMERFSANASEADWVRLARNNSPLAFAELERQASAVTANDSRLVARVNATLPLLCRANPDRTLALVAPLLRSNQFDTLLLQPLVAARPSATAALILALPSPDEQRSQQWNRLGGWGRHSYNFRSHLRQLSADQIIDLYRRNRQVFGWNGWFALVAPGARLAVYDALRRQLRYNSQLPADVIAALPTAQRQREARLVLTQSNLNASQRLSYATYLPWAEARQEIDPHLRATDPQQRMAALRALIGAVAYQRDRLGEALEVLRERRNEQDPVRNAMYTALGELAPSAFGASHLPDLEEIIRHGLNDVGLSHQTLSALLVLLVKLAPTYPDWACAQIAQAYRERGWSAIREAKSLAPTIELQLAHAIAPLLRVWTERGAEGTALSAIERIYARPDAFALAAGLLEMIIRQTHERDVAERALRLLGERDHMRFAALVPALLAEDASWYTLPMIAVYLARRRQDLLTPFLAYRGYEGRWNTGRQRILPTFATPLAGATAIQQGILADVALAIIADPEEASDITDQAIRLLALLPAIPAARVTPLASDPRPLVRTTALFVLAHLDTDRGLDALLDALNDTRARIAIHALHRFLVVMPTERALSILRAIPLDRVTVAKEVMRLTAELAPDAAFTELQAFDQRVLHRDVRIALLRSLDGYLDRPQAWEILERAARGPDPEVAQATLTLPTLSASHRLVEQAPVVTLNGALRLAGALLARSEASARAAALEYCRYLGVNDRAQIVTPTLFALIAVGLEAERTRAAYEEAKTALYALCGVCAPDEAARIGQLFVALLPQRRLLKVAVEALNGATRFRERGLESVIRAAMTTLDPDPLSARLRLQFAIAHLPTDEIVVLVSDLAARDALNADDLVWLCGQLVSPSQPTIRFTGAALATMENSWGASADPRLRRLALAALQAQAARANGWSAALIERLRAYRADPSILVAAAAQFTFPHADAPDDEAEDEVFNEDDENDEDE